jgi:hypothetical protein
MISENELIDYIRLRIPPLEPFWQGHLRSWAHEERGLCNDVEVLTEYTMHLIRSGGNEDDLRTVFETIEQLLISGNAEVINIVVTCFLESLHNLCSYEEDCESKFRHLLSAKTQREWAVISS